MTSPDQGLQLLAGAVEGEEGMHSGWDEPLVPPSMGRSTRTPSVASSRASPAPGWHRTSHRASPEPSDLFSY